MAEQNDDDTSSSSSSDASSSFDDDEDTDHELEEQQQLEQIFQRAAAPQPRGDNNDRLLVMTMLRSLGFEKKHIERGIRLYEKSYGTDNYNPDDVTQIILRLQEKEEIKKQKRQLLAMNLDPKLAAELFGDHGHKYGIKSKSNSATSGYHRGDIVTYREKISAQIMDRFDEYLLICWPITKPVYQRAVLWVNVKDIIQKKAHKEKGKGLFGGMFGSKGDKKEAQFAYKYEKIWRDMIVQNVDKTKEILCQMLDVEEKNKTSKIMKLVFVEQSKDEYAMCGMYELYNESVTRSYNKRKELIVRFSLDSDETKANELKLWHIASRREVCRIVKHGFKRKYGRMNAYGFGHKFYRNAHDALVTLGEYKKVACDSDQMHYLLYCSVVCGESCLGHEEMKIPHHKAAKSYILYETAVDDMDLTRNKCFITFQDYQAIAEYVLCIQPKKQEQSQFDFNPSAAKVFMQHFNPNPPPQQIKPDHNLPNIPPNYQPYAPMPQGFQYQQYIQNPNPPPNPMQFVPPQPQQHAQQHRMMQQHRHHRPPRHQHQQHQQQHAHAHAHVRHPQLQPQQQQQQQQRQQQRQPRHRQFQFVPFNPNNNNNNQQPQPQQQQDQVEDQNLFDSV
eukprot:429882_1